MYFASALSDDHLLSPDAACFPIQLKANQKPKIEAVQDSLLTLETPKDADALEITANLSQLARDYLIKLGITNPDADAETAGLIWHHALAIGYAPDYLLEHEDGIRNDYPRIPLPKTKELLLESAKLGRQIAQLLDTEVNIDGVTSGKILNELKAIGTIAKVGNGNLTRDELALTVHWGRSTSQGIMPGSGKLETRAYASDEKILKDLELGEETIDVYLNDVAYWRCIPERVWEYAIGGYQVIKKWLSYRDQSILERPITPEEAREVTAMSRRIAALLMLEPELNRNYRAVSSSENEDEIEASNA